MLRFKKYFIYFNLFIIYRFHNFIFSPFNVNFKNESLFSLYFIETSFCRRWIGRSSGSIDLDFSSYRFASSLLQFLNLMNGRLDLRGRALQAPQNFRRREGDLPLPTLRSSSRRARRADLPACGLCPHKGPEARSSRTSGQTVCSKGLQSGWVPADRQN